MTDDIDQFISEALVALAGTDNGIEAVIQTSPSRWVLGFSDDTQMDVQLDEATNRLVLEVDAGTIPEANRIRTMEALLAFNLIWAETGCLRAGVSPAAQAIILIGDIGLPDLTDERLAQAILRLSEVGRQWRAFATGAMHAPAAGVDDDMTMIRI